jgi:hypothetical protein
MTFGDVWFLAFPPTSESRISAMCRPQPPGVDAFCGTTEVPSVSQFCLKTAYMIITLWVSLHHVSMIDALCISPLPEQSLQRLQGGAGSSRGRRPTYLTPLERGTAAQSSIREISYETVLLLGTDKRLNQQGSGCV